MGERIGNSAGNGREKEKKISSEMDGRKNRKFRRKWAGERKGNSAGNGREKEKESFAGHGMEKIMESEETKNDKRIELYLRQKKLLDTFLGNHAITQAQYNKSLHDLTEKMGMEKILQNEGEQRGE